MKVTGSILDVGETDTDVIDAIDGAGGAGHDHGHDRDDQISEGAHDSLSCIRLFDSISVEGFTPPGRLERR